MTDDAPTPGWYADPSTAEQIRWWNGTDWSEDTAPAPRAAEPALPAPTGQPIAHEAPKPAEEKTLLDRAAGFLKDGQAQAGGAVGAGIALASQMLPGRAKAETATLSISPSAPSHEAAKAPGIGQKIKGVVADPRVQGVGVAAAGATLLADGAVGIGSKRKGIASAAKTFIIGGIVVAFSALMMIMGIGTAISGPTEALTTGTVTKILETGYNQCIPTVSFELEGQSHTTKPTIAASCTWEVGDEVSVIYPKSQGGAGATLAATGETPTTGPALITGAVFVFIIGFAVSAFGLAKLALRAGSIAGGLLLIRHGWRRGKTPDSAEQTSPEETVDA